MQMEWDPKMIRIRSFGSDSRIEFWINRIFLELVERIYFEYWIFKWNKWISFKCKWSGIRKWSGSGVLDPTPELSFGSFWFIRTQLGCQGFRPNCIFRCNKWLVKWCPIKIQILSFGSDSRIEFWIIWIFSESHCWSQENQCFCVAGDHSGGLVIHEKWQSDRKWQIRYKSTTICQ